MKVWLKLGNDETMNLREREAFNERWMKSLEEGLAQQWVSLLLLIQSFWTRLFHLLKTKGNISQHVLQVRTDYNKQFLYKVEWHCSHNARNSAQKHWVPSTPSKGQPTTRHKTEKQPRGWWLLWRSCGATARVGGFANRTMISHTLCKSGCYGTVARRKLL